MRTSTPVVKDTAIYTNMIPKRSTLSKKLEKSYLREGSSGGKLLKKCQG